MKTLIEYLKESQDNVYAIIDKDLDGAIMSIWNTSTEAETEKSERLKENDKLKIDIKKMKRSEVETTDKNETNN